jgi:3-deoxy-manno-octulosonate cytidylyltransferase (CMP-KDO synthetase)
MAKTIGVIPARYESTRIPGKPLADICGRPMLWWVYEQAVKVKGLDYVVIAVDSECVMKACKHYGMNAVMTSAAHEKHLDRVHEVSEKISADYYVVICGDEPLTEPWAAEQVLPDKSDLEREYVIKSLMRDFDDPVEAYDTASMKAAVNAEDFCIFLSRSIIPFPYKTVDYKLKRLVGIECLNKRALDFFVSAPPGILEKIEDITLLRYLENFIPIRLIATTARQIGVDTPKNLETVRGIIEDMIKKGERVQPGF